MVSIQWWVKPALAKQFICCGDDDDGTDDDDDDNDDAEYSKVLSLTISLVSRHCLCDRQENTEVQGVPDSE